MPGIVATAFVSPMSTPAYIVRGYVQVVATEARENQPTRAHSYGEESHSCSRRGTKVTTEQEKASRQGESWRV